MVTRTVPLAPARETKSYISSSPARGAAPTSMALFADSSYPSSESSSSCCGGPSYHPARPRYQPTIMSMFLCH